jgi:hypothetical protein
MIKVKTIIKVSLGKGVGLFVNQKIIKGQLIYDEESYKEICHKNNLLTLNQEEIDYYKRYCWREGDYIYCNTDNTMYINHSFEPNVVDGYAVRDINFGEELTEDYSTFDADFNDYIETYI